MVVEASQLIGDIKKQACEKENKPINNHQLKLGTRLLDDDKTVAHEGIDEHMCLLLALHVPFKLCIL